KTDIHQLRRFVRQHCFQIRISANLRGGIFLSSADVNLHFLCKTIRIDITDCQKANFPLPLQMPVCRHMSRLRNSSESNDRYIQHFPCSFQIYFCKIQSIASDVFLRNASKSEFDGKTSAVTHPSYPT